MKEARKCPQRLYKFVKWSNELRKCFDIESQKAFCEPKGIYIYIYVDHIYCKCETIVQIRTTTNVLFMDSRDCHHYARDKNIPRARAMYSLQHYKFDNVFSFVIHFF
jgi:hypothetical protein